MYGAYGRDSEWVYHGDSIAETTAGKCTTSKFASDGTLSKVVDLGGTIVYKYYPNGKIKMIIAPGNIITRMVYDIAGNRIKLKDPIIGTVYNSYNGFGDLVSETKSNSQTYFTYFDDGRIIQKTVTEGTYLYTYNNNKQLIRIKSPDNVFRCLQYDSHGRICSQTDSIPNLSSFKMTFHFDRFNRVDSIKHPSNIIEANNYNSFGYLSSVSTGGIQRWTTIGLNEQFKVTTARYGSSLLGNWHYDVNGILDSSSVGTVQRFGYSFDPVTGNLLSRNDKKRRNHIENFEYDNLMRLSQVSVGDSVTMTINYNATNSGIDSKTNIGTYSYEVSNNPYALSKIEPFNGNLPFNRDETSWTSFNKPRIITDDTTTLCFLYNSDNERARMIVKKASDTLLVRWYSFNSYIRDFTSPGTREFTFIGGNFYTAPIVAITQNGQTEYYDILRDYLGSITQVVKSSNDSLVAEYSYDPWGRMRNVQSWVNYNPGEEPQLFIAERGYTGHEHLVWVGLINMNGRVYDPLIGQFLSPDILIQNPLEAQDFNRYIYCNNNPLSYNDPSGHFGVLLSSLIYFAGMYAINLISNMINDHMSPKEAFKNTPVVVGFRGNFPMQKSSIPSSTSSSPGGISLSELDNFSNTQYGFSQPNYEYGHSFNFEDCGLQDDYSPKLYSNIAEGFQALLDGCYNYDYFTDRKRWKYERFAFLTNKGLVILPGEGIGWSNMFRDCSPSIAKGIELGYINMTRNTVWVLGMETKIFGSIHIHPSCADYIAAGQCGPNDCNDYSKGLSGPDDSLIQFGPAFVYDSGYGKIFRGISRPDLPWKVGHDDYPFNINFNFYNHLQP